MNTENEIRLRLRFYKDVSEPISVIKEKFQEHRDRQPHDYSVKVNDEHIWFHFKGEKKHYWSPHLHLELESKEENGTHIRGLFGPDSTLWTLFMFLHFVVAGIFTIFGMFAYSNYTLKVPLITDIVIMFIMVIIWFLLYVIARQIREKGHDQMNELEQAFLKIIN
ncbi:hypothetical protein [Flavobacterium sp.]